MSEISQLEQSLDRLLSEELGMSVEQVEEKYKHESHCYIPLEGGRCGEMPASDKIDKQDIS